MTTTTTTTTTEAVPVVTQGRVRRRHRVLSSDGVPLSVTDWSGPNPTHTAVFLHGLCLSHTAWNIQLNHVLRRFGPEVRVIAYDHRGHGDSGSAPSHTYRVHQLAADLDDVLDTLNVTGPIALIGHSMGGMTAMTYLHQGRRASQVASLVLCATAAGNLAMQGVGRLLAVPALEPLIRALAHVPENASGAVAAPLRLMLNRIGAVGGRNLAALAEVFADALAAVSLRTAVGFLTSLRDFDHTLHLGGIGARTTILSGGTDLLTPAALSWEMEAAIPGARHIHLPSAGHMLPQEAARTVNAAVAAAVEAASPIGRAWTWTASAVAQ